MNKIIKIFVKVLLALCLLPIMAVVVLALLLTIPSVQNSAVHMATQFASEKIGSAVHIEHISVGLFNRVKFRGVYVEDLSCDTILYVETLSARVGAPKDMFEDGITISSAEMNNAQFNLLETPRGVMNIKEIVDKISKKNGKGNFQLKIHNILAKNLDFRLKKLHPKGRSYGVDFSNMLLRGIDLQLDEFSVKGSAVGGTIRSMSFCEQSGFDVKNLSCDFWVDKGLVKISDLFISTLLSDFQMPSLKIEGDDWRSFGDFKRNVRIDASLTSGIVSSDDIAFFAPKLRNWHLTLEEPQLDFTGKISDFTADVKSVGFGSNGSISARAHILNVGISRVPRLDVDLRRLDAKSSDILLFLTPILHLSLAEKISSAIENVGQVSMQGFIRGRVDDFDSSIKLRMMYGGMVDANCRLRKGDDISICATCAVENVDLGRILSVKDLGTLSTVANVDGTLRNGGNLSYMCRVDECEFKGYTYSDISAIGSYINDSVSAKVISTDKNASLSADLNIGNISSTRPKLDLIGRISNLDFSNIGINRSDSLSRMSASLSCLAEGCKVDSLRGSFLITQAEYKSSNGTLHPDTISFHIDRNQKQSTFNIGSEYFTAQYSTCGHIKEDVRYAKNVIRRYLPSMLDSDSLDSVVDSLPLREDSQISVCTNNIDTLLNCISSGYSISPNTKLEMKINPSSNRFVADLNSQCIGRNQILGTELQVNLDNLTDTVNLRASAGDIYLSTMHASKINLSGRAENDKLSIDGFFSDSISNMHGRLKGDVIFSRPSGVKHIVLSVDSSFMENKQRRWTITSGRIEADTGCVRINRFVMLGDKQDSLILNGVASKSLQDSLCLTLNNFSLTPLVQFTNKIGYDVTGTSNGYVNVKSVLDKIVVNANVGLDSMRVNGIHLPKLRMLSKWNIASSRAVMNIISEAKRDTLVRGFYSPQRAKYYAEAKMDSVDLSLLDPVLSGVVSNTGGKACVKMELVGSGRDLSLTGGIDVRNFSTMVDFTKCTYSISKARIGINNNRFILDDTDFADKNGKKGKINMNLSLEHLSNIKYALGVKFSNMQVLDTSSKDNEMFYGSIRATGSLKVTGTRGSTKLDILAVTNDGSEFFMPLSGKNSISNADFVRFESSSNRDSVNYLLRKKMMFERKSKKSAVSNDMGISMGLTLTPSAEIQLVIDPTVGDILKARGNGTLNINIRPKRNVFEMLGDYTITQGSYLFTLQHVINKRFTISPGSMIQWTGEPLDALLNINAVYRLKASLQPLLAGSISSDAISSTAVPVNCILMLRDRLTHPTVDFNVEVPNSDASVQSIVSEVLSTPEGRSRQFLYLLIGNNFVSEGNSSASSGASSTVAVTGLELLSNQLSNWLSNDDYRVILRFRPKTERNMSDEVDFGFSKGLIDNRLFIEVEGNYYVDKPNFVNSNSNFAGEAYVTWLIDKAGTMRLKGFTHTIDRFDDTQGLQETGLGIYYKEDFDNAADFKKRIKYRFTRKKKLKRMQEQRDSTSITSKKQK